MDVNKMTLDELNDYIERNARKINERLGRLAATKGHYAGSAAQKVELQYARKVAERADVKMTTATTHSGATVRVPQFSTKKFKGSQINKARATAKALEKLGKSSASVSGLRSTDVKRKAAFENIIGGRLTWQQYYEFMDSMENKEKISGGSQAIITAFGSYYNAYNDGAIPRSQKLTADELLELADEPLDEGIADYLDGLGVDASDYMTMDFGGIL